MASSEGGILLVEDNEDESDLIQRAFRRAGIRNPIEVAGDGEEALLKLQSSAAEPPLLVLLDLKLPRRSGFEVLEWLRRNAATKRLTVVVLTSSRQSADVDRAYDLGANSYLVKPVNSESLAAMVKALDLYWLQLNQPPSPAVRNGSA